MKTRRRRRFQPKVEDAVVLLICLAAMPAAVAVCALVNAIYEAWRRSIGA